MRLLAVALRTLWFQSRLFFLERRLHFKDSLALFALIIIERHKYQIPLAGGVICEGGEINAE